MIFISYLLFGWTLFGAGWYVYTWISKLSLPLKKLLPASLISALIICVNLVSGTIVDVVHLLLIGFIFFKFEPKRKLVFYAFYTTIALEFLLSLSYYIVFRADPNQINLGDYPLYKLLVANLLVIPEYWVVHTVFNLNFKSITESNNKRTKNFLVEISVALIVSYLILHVIYLLSDIHDNSTINWLTANRNKVVFVGVTVFCWFLFGFNRWVRRTLKQDIEYDRELHIANLETYNHRVEALYDELSTFKRNYQFALERLAKSIASQDMDNIKTTYEQILGNADQAQQISRSKNSDIGKLSAIQVSPIKSMLSAKIVQAQEAGIQVTIEVPDQIEQIPMKIIDLVTIIGILSDNAIESAKESEEKAISVAYFMVDNQQFFVIENSTREDQVPISHIFEDGFSSKGTNRGIGLANVERIIAEYANVSLSTRSADYSFRQTLAMVEEPANQ